jgi:fructose-bisphosphate aldolase class II
VPLVLHGSSGVPDETLRAAVRAGLTKINIATQLNKVFTAAVRARLTDDPLLADPRRYLRAGRAAVAAEVERLLRLLAGPVAADPAAGQPVAEQPELKRPLVTDAARAEDGPP